MTPDELKSLYVFKFLANDGKLSSLVFLQSYDKDLIYVIQYISPNDMVYFHELHLRIDMHGMRFYDVLHMFTVVRVDIDKFVNDVAAGFTPMDYDFNNTRIPRIEEYHSLLRDAFIKPGKGELAVNIIDWRPLPWLT